MHLLRFSFAENRLAILGRLALNIPVCIPDIHSINRFAGCARLSAIHFGLSATVHGMFTGVPQKHRQAAETYFDEHLSHNDYYTQGETQHGQWIGIGAERLGLKPGDVVTREEFLRLCDNQHPLTGERLTPQHFRDRRIYFDFVCSPPKSVSILAVTMNDRRIIEAHKEASMIALHELESFAATRIRKGGVEDKDRVTDNLVGAAFLHTTSRALDPQLHTHFVLFNCTWDNKEQRWKALQTGGMFGALLPCRSSGRSRSGSEPRPLRRCVASVSWRTAGFLWSPPDRSSTRRSLSSKGRHSRRGGTLQQSAWRGSSKSARAISQLASSSKASFGEMPVLHTFRSTPWVRVSSMWTTT